MKWEAGEGSLLGSDLATKYLSFSGLRTEGGGSRGLGAVELDLWAVPWSGGAVGVCGERNVQASFSANTANSNRVTAEAPQGIAPLFPPPMPFALESGGLGENGLLLQVRKHWSLVSFGDEGNFAGNLRIGGLPQKSGQRGQYYSSTI